MREEIFEAKTIEGAVLLALDEWNCRRDEIEYEVLQEPAKGIFGQLRTAKVRIREKAYPAGSTVSLDPTMGDSEDFAKKFIQEIFKFMAIDEYAVEIHREENNIFIRIKTTYEGLLIGHHGKTLEAIQYLINRLAGAKKESDVHFIIDIGGYLEKQKLMLEKMAIKAAEKVKESHEDVQLKPLNAFERRIIHMKLRDDQEIRTYSVGEGKIKNLIISFKNKE